MAFIKLLFVLMILVPVAIVMLFLINKLLNDFSESVKNEYSESPEERARRKGRKPESYGERKQYGSEYSQRSDAYGSTSYGHRSTMEGNPSYEAYRKARSRQEEKINDRSVYSHHGESGRNRQKQKNSKKSSSRKHKRTGKSGHRRSHK